jgi:hypothetical protein
MTEQKTETPMVTPAMEETDEELKERKREYQRKYRLKKLGEPTKKTPLTDEEKAIKKQQSIEYQRHYRAQNKEKAKVALAEWKVKNADKIKEEREQNKAKYAAIQRAYDKKMRDDPHYIALNDARQKRYRENKKLNPENYKQKEPKDAKKRGRPRKRGVIVEPTDAN